MTSSYHLAELLILSYRVKDVLGVVSISIVRFEYVLYKKARNFNLNKKCKHLILRPYRITTAKDSSLARGILLNREEGKLGSNSQMSGHEQNALSFVYNVSVMCLTTCASIRLLFIGRQNILNGRDKVFVVPPRSFAQISKIRQNRAGTNSATPGDLVWYSPPSSCLLGDSSSLEVWLFFSYLKCVYHVCTSCQH